MGTGMTDTRRKQGWAGYRGRDRRSGGALGFRDLRRVGRDNQGDGETGRGQGDHEIPYPELEIKRIQRESERLIASERSLAEPGSALHEYERCEEECEGARRSPRSSQLLFSRRSPVLQRGVLTRGSIQRVMM